MLLTRRKTTLLLTSVGVVLIGTAVAAVNETPRVIEVTADSDNRFKIPKQKAPVITMRVNEVAVLRITSRRGGEWDEKDGAVHTFTINALKDRGWNFRLKEGTQKFPVVAPNEPGEYVVECTIKCGKGHDDMKMKLVVTQ
jgi:heme/copper-type cytochrome/quinol oxidase subunit 2